MNRISETFSSQHVIVTGGGSGIGAATALAFRQQGAAVTILGRNEERLTATAKELGVAHCTADVTDAKSVTAAFEQAISSQGAISILINNAGAAESCAFHKTDHELWQRMLSVNLTGVYNCCSAAIPGMLAGGQGRIVNIASTAAQKGYAYVSAYCAAKHGVLGLTRALALEYAKRNITVNAVCPGFTNTGLVENSLNKIVDATGRSKTEALDELIKNNPQHRLIEPDEVAAAVIWLCRAGSCSITGQAISVAGGEIM